MHQAVYGRNVLTLSPVSMASLVSLSLTLFPPLFLSLYMILYYSFFRSSLCRTIKLYFCHLLIDSIKGMNSLVNIYNRDIFVLLHEIYSQLPFSLFCYATIFFFFTSALAAFGFFRLSPHSVCLSLIHFHFLSHFFSCSLHCFICLPIYLSLLLYQYQSI